MEPAAQQGRRLTQLLFNLSVGDSGSDDRKKLTAPVFVMVFYLLKVVLERGGEAVGREEATMVNATKIIIAHAAMRQSEDGDEVSRL